MGLFDSFNDKSDQQPTDSYKEGAEAGRNETVVGSILHDLADMVQEIVPTPGSPTQQDNEREAGYHDGRDGKR